MLLRFFHAGRLHANPKPDPATILTAHSIADYVESHFNSFWFTCVASLQRVFGNTNHRPVDVKRVSHRLGHIMCSADRWSDGDIRLGLLSDRFERLCH